MSRDDAWLRDMLDAAKEELDRIVGYDLERFRADRDKQLAVMHLIVIIGEAAAHVSADTRTQLPDVP